MAVVARQFAGDRSENSKSPACLPARAHPAGLRKSALAVFGAIVDLD